jgi:hypothetical protein
MDLLTALRILLRRWPVVVVGLVLTTLGYIQVGKMIEPTYEAKTTVMFQSPQAEAGDNPFSQFGANLDIAASAMKTVMESPTGARRLEAEGATGSFKIEALGGPLLDITADDATQEGAVTSIEAMVMGIQKEMVAQQNNAPLPQQITVRALTTPTPKAKFGSRIRAQFAVVAIGLAATAAAGLAVDALMLQYRDAKARRREEEDEWDEAGYRSDGPYAPRAGVPGARSTQPSHSTYRPASRPAPAASPSSAPQPQPASASSRPGNGATGGPSAAPVNGDGRGAPAGARPSGGSSGRTGAPGAPGGPSGSRPAPGAGSPTAPTRGQPAPNGSGAPSGTSAAPTRGQPAPSGSGGPSGRPRPPAGPAGQPSGGSGPGARPAHAPGNGSRPAAPSPGPSRSVPPSGGPAASAAPAGAVTVSAGDTGDLRSQIGQLTSGPNGTATGTGARGAAKGSATGGAAGKGAGGKGSGTHAGGNGSGRPAPDTRGAQGQRATWR